MEKRDGRRRYCPKDIYASMVDACWVDEQCVSAAPGNFNCGWITAHVKGPSRARQGRWVSRLWPGKS
jgi:hypothetical protein